MTLRYWYALNSPSCSGFCPPRVGRPCVRMKLVNRPTVIFFDVYKINKFVFQNEDLSRLTDLTYNKV